MLHAGACAHDADGAAHRQPFVPAPGGSASRSSKPGSRARRRAPSKQVTGSLSSAAQTIAQPPQLDEALALNREVGTRVSLAEGLENFALIAFMVDEAGRPWIRYGRPASSKAVSSSLRR
jgi:hypothetical protein